MKVDGEVVNKENLNQKINEILASLFELDINDMTPESNLFTDFGLDSLDAIDMVLAFQNKFGIKAENDEVKNIRTLSDVYSVVHKYYDSHNQNS